MAGNDPGISVVANKTTDDRPVLLFYAGLIVFPVGTGPGELNMIDFTIFEVVRKLRDA
ncbi:MAG: hypothetical protein WBC70_05840 [Candidatus Aminicenantales bacterium]